MLILATILAYFCALLAISRLTARRSSGNDAFYSGCRRSPWRMVAFGMIGASISGVTFVSVPGMALGSGMTYLQMCLGFVPGYLAVAFVLLPVYYRLRLTTIYGWLADRLGRRSHVTGAAFFLMSKMAGSAVRFYVVCMVLHRFVLAPVGVPFAVTVVAMVGLIWLYTRRGGIGTLVWTDSFQTLCMLVALALIVANVVSELGMTLPQAARAIAADGRGRVFVFDDWVSRHNFWKQFLSGAFVVMVMTGMDQDMMQKNLTCRTLADARKDMCAYGLAFVPVNLLFLSLGVLLAMLAERTGTPLPSNPDELLPMFAATGRLGDAVVVMFTIGVVAAAFSSADSALTALTTTFCVDLAGRPADEALRRRAHVGMAAVFALFILAFDAVNGTSAIDAIYVLCSYTYGPLLGLFAYGLFTRHTVADRLVPVVCVSSPLLCLALDRTVSSLTGYRLGYELLMLNGALTFLGLRLTAAFRQGKGGKPTPGASLLRKVTLAAALAVVVVVALWLAWRSLPASAGDMRRSACAVEGRVSLCLVAGTDTLVLRSDSVAQQGVWVDHHWWWPGCRGRLLTVSRGGMPTDTARMAHAPLDVLAERIDSLGSLLGRKETERKELAYYLRTHGVMDEGYDRIAAYASAQITETDSLARLAERLCEWRDRNAARTRRGCAIARKHEYVVKWRDGRDSLLTARAEPVVLPPEACGRAVEVRARVTGNPHGAYAVRRLPWVGGCRGDILAVVVPSILASGTCDSLGRHDLPRLFAADGTPVFTAHGRFVGVVSGKEVVR